MCSRFSPGRNPFYDQFQSCIGLPIYKDIPSFYPSSAMGKSENQLKKGISHRENPNFHYEKHINIGVLYGKMSYFRYEDDN